MRKMAAVTERTSIDRLKMDRAGVPAGEKMLVGDWARAVAVQASAESAPRAARADRRTVLGEDVAVACLAIGNKAV